MNSGTVTANQQFGRNALIINGNVTNSGGMGTSYAGFQNSGNNFIDITGKLNNSGGFSLRSPGDEVNISGHVNNSGSFGLIR